MQTTLTSEDLAFALAEIRTTDVVSSKTANLLIQKYLPAIRQLVSTYPLFWQEDLLQEGKIALLNSARKFSDPKKKKDFFNYAYTSIRNHIINFYYSVIKRQPQIEEPVICKVDENEFEESYFNYTDDFNAANSRALALDIKMQLSELGMTKNGFTKQEIKAFRDYYINGYSITEVAKHMGTSVSHASKIKNRVRSSMREILN